MRHSQTVFVLISIDTSQSPSSAQRQHHRVGARTARPLRVWARIFRAHIPAHLPVPGLIRPAALASRARRSFTVRPTMPHTRLCQPLSSPSDPQTTVAETTCHIQHTRTATETRFDLSACPPCFLQLCRARRHFNTGSSLRGTCKSTFGAMPCRTSFRTLASAMSRVAGCQANSVTGMPSPSGKFCQNCSSASSRRVEEATKTDVWSSLPT